MKLLSKNRITSAVAAAAIAGFSFSSAFAVPSYEPPADSPVDATSLSSSSTVLANFNDFLGDIQAQLQLINGAATLATPSSFDDDDFYAAVSNAVGNDSGNAYGIAQAAVAYYPKKIKFILTKLANDNPTVAADAVGGAALAYPKKAADAALGAILGIIASGVVAEIDGAADDAVIDETSIYVGKIANAAVKALKSASPADQERADVVAASIVTQLVAIGEIRYVSEVGFGAIKGAAGLLKASPTAQGDVAAAMSDALIVAGGTKSDIVALAMGSLKGSSIPAQYGPVLSGLAGHVDGNEAAVNAGADAQLKVRTKVIQDETTFKTALDATNAAEVAAFVRGAAQAKKGGVKDYIPWAITDADVAINPTLAAEIIAAGVSGNFAQAGKAVIGAVSTGAITADLALAAAIPASTDFYAGKTTQSAYKAAALPDGAASTGDAVTILEAGINAAAGAGFEGALGDITTAAIKSTKKINPDAIATAAVDAVPTGWEEAVAAAAAAALPSTKPASDAAALAKGGAALETSVALATQIAGNGKSFKKTLFEDALQAYLANPSLARSVLLGAGSVNGKLATPLLGAAMRLGVGGDSAAVLLNYAISLNKKKEADVRLGYLVATDVIASPDNIFDIVDHQTFINPKGAVAITEGAVSARPEFAHYATRAAAFRAGKLAGKIGTAAIQFAHMRVLDSNDPAAVAAISAALVLGIQDANLGTKEEAAIKNGVAGLIKGTLSFPNDKVIFPLDAKSGLIGSAEDFPEADGSSNTVAGPNRFAKGTAGVVTGVIAQLQGEGDETLTSLSAIAISSAVKKAKSHALAIAQAAAQAAWFVADAGAGVFADVLGIVNAVVASGPKFTPTEIQNAVELGILQASTGVLGAGAAGIRNYDHHSGLNAPVTSLVNF